jgi:hypothetical protein
MSHVALDFDEALENFKTMFPGVPEDIITDLLRRENGDVEKVVNELLAFSSNPVSFCFIIFKRIFCTFVSHRFFFSSCIFIF